MQNQTYLFYDIETTGLNKCFDQVLQFAAIRTDKQLVELERHDIQIRLNPDVVPSPFAAITHRIPISDYAQGLLEVEAMQKIHTLLNTPNTISVGYNSLGFDDEFLRFSFYRNLLSPYTHQYANGCGRMDIYPIVILYYLFKNDTLLWPNGNLKLENINHCNQLFNGQAHNAMVDVEVTLALAKKLSQDPAMWCFSVDCFYKPSDEARIASSDKIGLMVYGKIGSAANYIVPVLHVGQHQHYKNQSLWLRLDEPNLMNTTEKNILKTTKLFRKRFGEPPIFLPIKERYLNLLSDDRKKIFESNKAWAENNPLVIKSISAFYQNEKYPEVPERDIDAALYDIGFSKPYEEKLFHQFLSASPEKKYTIAAQFPSPIRKMQAMRILGRYFQNQLPDPEKIIVQHYLQSNPIDFRGQKKLTRAAALLEINEIEAKNTLDDEQKKLLAGLKKLINEKQT
ncbi:MAG: exodeoxyribonuclease I [Gammaproteobacteria bacterium CG_4_9_14_3_um_filter_38_9]|nr:MAG: exodeoxyribonuclease I [Gammaproteobacteria bacterium CG_4_9_14_3_um_filter_38_9]